MPFYAFQPQQLADIIHRQCACSSVQTLRAHSRPLWVCTSQGGPFPLANTVDRSTRQDNRADTCRFHSDFHGGYAGAAFFFPVYLPRASFHDPGLPLPPAPAPATTAPRPVL